jgi:hypothetical protein
MLVTNWASAKPTGTGSTIGAGLTTTAVTTTSQLCAVNASNLSLSISVAASSSTTTPTGTVQILVDNAPMGTATLANSATAGIATATFSFSSVTITSGGHTVSAVYSGDGNYAGSKGTLLAAAVGSAQPTFASIDFVSATQKDFSLTPCTGAVTVASGATSTGVTFTITPANGFTGAVTLAAVNNNLGAFTPSFSVTPVNITSASGVTTSFIVKASQTTAQLIQPHLTPSQHHPSGKTPWYAAGSSATLACMLLLTVPRRRRWAGLLAVILSLAVFTAVGCGGNTSTTGGSSGGGTGTGGTTNAQRGTYTFTITAVSGTLVHSAQVTVTVQ